MKNNSSNIIFIPSYGTDSTLYSDLQVNERYTSQIVKTEWLPVGNCKDFRDYAQKFIKHYNITSSDILVGTSLGGIIAQEINKLIHVRKVLIISSLKSSKEMPFLFSLLKKGRLYYLFSPSLLKIGLDFLVPLYGRNIRRYVWFRRVFKSSNNEFLRWSLKQIVHWENNEQLTNVIQIHGTKDPLFPIRNIENPNYLIENGTHAMIRFKAKEISTIIERELSEFTESVSRKRH